MRPPTFPVAPSKIAEYCAFASAAAIVTSPARGTKDTPSPEASEVLLSGDFFPSFLLSHSFYDVSLVLLPKV
jgi:hypothetical protein